MNRRFSAFFLLAILSAFVFCENPNVHLHAKVKSQAKVTPQTKFIHLSQPMKAKVSQVKTLKGIGFPVKSSGFSAFLPGTGVYYETQEPIRQAVAFSEAGIVEFDDKGHPIQNKATDNLVDKMISQLLVALMNQNESQLRQWFNIESKKLKENDLIRLMPKTNFLKKAIEYIEINQSNYLYSIRILTRQGDITLLNFSDYTAISSSELIDYCAKFSGEKKGICHKNP